MSTPNQVGLKLGLPPPAGGVIPQAKDKWMYDARRPPTIEQTYRDLYEGWAERCPQIYSAFPGSSFYYLKTVECEQLETNGLLCDVTLHYEWNLASSPPNIQIPPTLVDENDGTTEEPIELNPDFTSAIAGTPASPLNGALFDPTTQKFIGFTPGSTYYGVTKFKVGTLSVSITQYAATPFASIAGVMGHLQDPGFDFGHAGMWLVVSGHRGKSGAFFTLTTVYEFSSIGFIPGLYSYVTSMGSS